MTTKKPANPPTAADIQATIERTRTEWIAEYAPRVEEAVRELLTKNLKKLIFDELGIDDAFGGSYRLKTYIPVYGAGDYPLWKDLQLKVRAYAPRAVDEIIDTFQFSAEQMTKLRKVVQEQYYEELLRVVRLLAAEKAAQDAAKWIEDAIDVPALTSDAEEAVTNYVNRDW